MRALGVIPEFWILQDLIQFGEFFGDLPERLFRIEPFCVERRTAIVPMLFFSLTVGAVHVLLGLFLGAATAFRKKTTGEAIYKLLSIVVILLTAVVLASFFGVFPGPLARPVIIAILFLAPLLFFTGGLLAPLELLKSIGNIISYVRIMAIGLTSVLLAFVANRLGGLTGDVHGVTGVIAILLMLVHAVWATVVLVRRDERLIHTFHRFSIVVWLVWLVPYFSPMFVAIAGRAK